MPEQPPCVKLVKLERAVIAAVEAAYSAKGEDRITARALERDAVQALDDHVKEHECK